MTRRARKCTGYNKVFTGCWTCRSRKVKCDEKTPSCTPCVKGGRKCTGYQQTLVWVGNDQKSYRHNGRRFLDPSTTWNASRRPSFSCIDDLINDCDIHIEEDSVIEISCTPFSVFRKLPGKVLNNDRSANSTKFGDGGVEDVCPVSLSESSLSMCQTNNEWSMPLYSMSFPGQLTMLQEPRAENRLDKEDAYLFHYYLNRVVPILTPVHNFQNPWLRYPAIALHQSFNGGQKHLLHAMMALAAIFLSNTDGDREAMSLTGTKLYSRAMVELRTSIDSGTFDYLGLLTTILTFLFIELFQGNSKTWRCHLAAAWKFVQQHRGSKSWMSSEDSWYVTQSFYLLRIESETSALSRIDLDVPEEEIVVPDYAVSLEKLSCNPVFGRTIGASSSVLACLSEINRVSIKPVQDQLPTDPTSASLRMTRMLLEYHWSSGLAPNTRTHMDLNYLEVSDHERKAQELHVRAFEVATIIYYHQILDNATPEHLAPYVSEVLRCISAFIELCGGNYTLWPAFIAGVCLYEEIDKESFLPLFENAASIGMNNRLKAKELIKHVWHIRSSIAQDTGHSPGKIWVDWRQIMHDLDIDILLV